MRILILLPSLILFVNLLWSQSWESMASLPGGFQDARHHPVTFSIEGYGYVLGGSVNGEDSDDFMRYDALADTWEQLPDFPGVARSFSYGTARGAKAYVGFGGSDGMALNDLWEYDVDTEEWKQLADCPCEGRYHPAFVQLDDKIYVGMGNNSRNLNDWWEYDIPSDTWTQKDDLPGPPRHHPYHFGIDSVAYVLFGHGNNDSLGNLSIYNDVYKFDPATDEWTVLNDFPGEGRVAGTQFDYKGKGYVLSGDGDDHSYMETGEFWEYDPEIDTWNQLAPHPGSSRWAPGSFVIENYVYFLCGLSDIQLESDMMRFELEPLTSTSRPIIAKPVSVFPNPATTYLNIVGDINEFSEVRLVNSYGQHLQTVNSNLVALDGLSNGLYYLQFVKDESMYTEKIMVID